MFGRQVFLIDDRLDTSVDGGCVNLAMREVCYMLGFNRVNDSVGDC